MVFKIEKLWTRQPQTYIGCHIYYTQSVHFLLHSKFVENE